MYITLEEAKQHLRVDLDYDGDDDLIRDIILDVEDVAASDLCVSLQELETEYGVLPRTIRRAMLLLIGSFYKNAEDEIPNSESAQMRNGYNRLISNYRNYER